jgi:hypothetical protein
MKRFLLIVFLVSTITGLKAKILRSDTIVIHQTTFLFVKYTEKSEFVNAIDTLLKVYRIEDGVRKYLLKQDIFTSSADCNSEFENHGTYEIKGDSVIFMTLFYFDASKNAGLPDREKQIYVVRDGGKMILVYDAEEYGDEWRPK